jgi:hypothetical protein
VRWLHVCACVRHASCDHNTPKVDQDAQRERGPDVRCTAKHKHTRVVRMLTPPNLVLSHPHLLSNNAHTGEAKDTPTCSNCHAPRLSPGRCSPACDVVMDSGPAQTVRAPHTHTHIMSTDSAFDNRCVVLCNSSFASHRIASHRIASHRIASHLISRAIGFLGGSG